MKKILAICLLGLYCFNCSAQSNTMFVRHDTILLNANECEWLVKENMQQTAMTGRSVPAIILDAIAAGKLKARDPQTMKLIPAKEIFVWGQQADSIMVWNEKKKENVVKTVQQLIKPGDISGIRIYHDWFFDVSSGKIQSIVQVIELMQEVRSPDGEFRGYKVLCQVEQ